MGTLINCLRRNNHRYIDDLSSLNMNLLKPTLNGSVLSKSLIYSCLSRFKSNKYLSDSVVDTYLSIRNLFSVSNIWHLHPLLPDDIIRLEILTRLPLKSLIRLQCVSKSWQSFIMDGDPDFIKSHLARTSTDPNNDYLIIEYCSAGRKAKKTNYWWFKCLSFVGSVNGLVCLYYFNWQTLTVVCFGMWNPATNRYKDIPSPSNTRYRTPISFSVGFGFDAIANDYKIIFLTITPDHPLVADIYSCNAGSWSNTNVASTIISCGDFVKLATHVSGRLHWRNCNRPDGEYFVISFDISHKVFRLLPQPVLVDTSEQYSTLMNLKDSLAFIVHHLVNITPIDIYIFDEAISSACGGGGGGWSKKYTVGQITLTPYLSFLQCFRNGDLLFTGGERFKFVAIDPETHEIKGLDTDIDPNTLGPNLFLSYTETLVSIKGMNQIQINEEAPSILLIGREV